MDAEKEVQQAKKLKMMGNRKQKKLTDDWRFWAACIATVGFASALWSVYQQTGGLGSGLELGSGSGFGSGVPDVFGMGGGGRQELEL